MCSKCNGAQDRNGADCEKNPPPPVRCFSSAGCMIAREYNKFGACRGILFSVIVGKRYYCWLVRVSLFIELGGPRDLGTEWRGDLGTFMISRPI